MDKFRYFIVPIQHSLSGSDEKTANNCRVVSENYRELFGFTLNSKDTEAFIKIMESDKDALLYRTHEILGELAYWKIDFHQKTDVVDGIKYP